MSLHAAPVDLDCLRARLRRLERPKASHAVLPLGSPLDAALPDGGLALACLHQIAHPAATPFAATAFAARIAGGLAARIGLPVLWIAGEDGPYPPGLRHWGLPPAQLIQVRAPRPIDRLYAAEEALRSAALACVVADLTGLDSISGRRLQLAAEAGSVTGLILHPDNARAANAGHSRWHVTAAPVGGWTIRLDRCRGGMPARWTEVRCG